MSTALPIGRKEDQRLEFKGRDSLARPDSIAREVVALLNADGGEVWVGFREDRGVAVEIESLADPERERERLRDRLADLIEPPPTGDEVQIETVGEPTKALRIRATPDAGRRPYALRRGGHLEFPIRFMDRLRPMTRSEIEETFVAAGSRRGGAAAAAPSAEEGFLLGDQREVVASEAAIFWIGLEPADGSRRLDLSRLWESRILEDPPLSGNLWDGMNVHHALRSVSFEEHPAEPGVHHRHGRSWLSVGRGSPFEFALSETAGLRSSVLLDILSSPPWPEVSPFPELRGAQVLRPRALLEYPASLFRLLRALGDHELLEITLGEVFAAVALTGVNGRYIGPGPDHPAWDYPAGLRVLPPALRRRPQPFTDGESFVGPVLRFTDHDILASPDGCAFRLMVQVFAAFGWLETEIPYFDRATGRLDFLP